MSGRVADTFQEKTCFVDRRNDCCCFHLIQSKPARVVVAVLEKNIKHPNRTKKKKNKDDSPDLLASDVHTAGAGICDDSAVMKLAREGPGRVEEMLLRGTSEVRERGGRKKVETSGGWLAAYT